MTTKTEALLTGIQAFGGRPVDTRATKYRPFAVDLPCRIKTDIGTTESFRQYYLFVTVRGGASLRLRRATGQTIGQAWDESMVAPESLKNVLLTKGGYHD